VASSRRASRLREAVIDGAAPGSPDDRAASVSTGDALIIAALAAAALDWIAVARRSKRAEYVFKPLTLTLLIAAAVAYRRPPPLDARATFTIAALVLCLAGDIFLMLPGDLFVAGLASFLLAHVAYVLAFTAAPPPSPALFPPESRPMTAWLVGGAVVLAVIVPLFLRIRAGIVRQGRGELVVPVGLYVLAIGAMVASAIATIALPEWTTGASALAIIGAALFLVSDAMIGWTRFVQPIRGSPVAIMVTYHLAQAALVVALLGIPSIVAS
jgi:uncharacterized membrane protein YhhN